MSEKVKMKALKGFKYAEEQVKAGDVFLARKKDVKVLEVIRRAKTVANDVDIAEKPAEKPAEGFPAVESVDIQDMDKDALREEYKRVFGKAAHGRTSEETLREELAKAKESEA